MKRLFVIIFLYMFSITCFSQDEMIVVEHIGPNDPTILPAYFLSGCDKFDDYVNEDPDFRYLHQCLNAKTFIKIDSIICTCSLVKEKSSSYSFGTFRISRFSDTEKVYEYYIVGKKNSIEFFQKIISATKDTPSSETVAKKMNYFVEVIDLNDN